MTILILILVGLYCRYCSLSDLARICTQSSQVIPTMIARDIICLLVLFLYTCSVFVVNYSFLISQ